MRSHPEEDVRSTVEWQVARVLLECTIGQGRRGTCARDVGCAASLMFQHLVTFGRHLDGGISTAHSYDRQSQICTSRRRKRK